MCLYLLARKMIPRMKYDLMKRQFLWTFSQKILRNFSDLPPKSSSVLFIPGNRASETYSVLTPYLDTSKHVNNLQILEKNLFRRGMKADLQQFITHWNRLQSAKRDKAHLEKRKNKIPNLAEKLKKADSEVNRNKLSILKEEGKQIRAKMKEINQGLWVLEENVAFFALEFPNDIHPSVYDVDQVLYEFSKEREFSFPCKSHVEIGEKLGSLERLDSSPSAYYLKGTLAALELEIADFFLQEFENREFVLSSNTDFAKSVVVEGCGLDFTNSNQVLTIEASKDKVDQNALHLVGGASLVSFAAFFAKHVISADSFPQKFITHGRSYRPAVDDLGLFGTSQCNGVDAFVVFSEGESEDQILDDLLTALIESYKLFEVHFTVVRYKASALAVYEKAAISIQMYSPAMKKNYEVGRISVCGDYISRRLWSVTKKRQHASFLSMMHMRVCNVTHMLALLMENFQNEDSKLMLPSCLKPYTYGLV
ncbi:seryl-tRNA synthetase-like insect mitochondrial protein [Oratosquilla oratoria]|uniref:seryl-tRNA synthetase-like insect mitochondrial protein n=1 Tax=Oratosquilla oratoria TaxID=337810 RepID=UPI003F767BCD